MGQLKKYADSDFFLALMKDSDWLKQKALKIYNKSKGNIWVSPFTVAEIMIVCKREDIPLRKVIIQISRIAILDSVSWEIFFRACDYIEQGSTIFDSLLMGFCGKNKVISPDNVFEKFGFDVVSLK